MLTISNYLQEKIERTPFLEDGIRRGLINLSALAREFKPDIEKLMMKPVSHSAVLMSLKRIADSLPKSPMFSQKVSRGLGDISVRSNLMEFTFLRSETLFETQKKLLLNLDPDREQFLTFTQGIYELTIISGSSLELRIEAVFKNEKLKSKLVGLSAVILKLPTESVDQPGIHYNILKQLAWNGINVVEVVSTFTEFIVVLSKKDIDFAFSTLVNAFT